MSTTRAISASRQRTGSRSPRRACAVRSIPTRSSTSPVSNNPASGSLTASAAAQEVAIPFDDEVSPGEGDGSADSQKYPEWHESLLAQRQRDEDQRAQERARKNRQQHPFPADETAHHGHHLDIAAAHRFFLEHPATRDPDHVEQAEPRRGAEHRVQEPLPASHQREREADPQASPRELVRDDVVPGVRDADPEQDRSQER